MGVKRPEHEYDYSPPSSAKIKECVELHLHSPNTLLWRGAQLKHRDNFTFTFTFTVYLFFCFAGNLLGILQPSALVLINVRGAGVGVGASTRVEHDKLISRSCWMKQRGRPSFYPDIENTAKIFDFKYHSTTAIFSLV
jgi:hypothetical protein